MNTDLNQLITDYTKELRLPVFRNQYAEVAGQAALNQSSYEEFLVRLLELEYEKRLENRRKQRLRRAGFPFMKYLHELQVESLPKDAREKLTLLKRLDFLTHGQNIVLAGNPGTGKTHLAIGLGIEACLKGHHVLFTSVPRLLTQIREAKSERVLRALESRFEKYDLVICDELGYISFDKEGAEMLFNHLSLRAGRKSTIITTNLSFERWSEVFGDVVLTAALVDRLTHKSFLINMNGNSYRTKETKDWIQNNQNNSSQTETKNTHE